MSRKVAKSNRKVGANACQVCCFVTFRHSLLCRSSYLIRLNVCFWSFNFFKLIYCDAPLEAQSTGVLAIISTAVIVIVSGLCHHHLQFQGFTRFEAQKKRPSGPREDQHFLLFCTMFANKSDEKKRGSFPILFPIFRVTSTCNRGKRRGRIAKINTGKRLDCCQVKQGFFGGQQCGQAARGRVPKLLARANPKTHAPAKTGTRSAGSWLLADRAPPCLESIHLGALLGFLGGGGS